jgi:LuxR family maltose regulon positive regulatory protein
MSGVAPACSGVNARGGGEVREGEVDAVGQRVDVLPGARTGDAPRSPRPAPLIATKFHAPTRVAAHRDRPRLDAALDRALDDATRLTLLSAPPGYGKSVAVAGWLASAGVPWSWLSLDPADNDAVRFARYLAAALERVRPGLADMAPDLLEAMRGPEGGAVLVDAIASTDDPFVLVLDDYHVITAEPIHALLRFVVEHGPPFAHLVVITREDPPLPLARLRAHGRLVELRAEELRFTTDEATGFLGATSGLELDDRRSARLAERTEGWIAGLQLAAISLRERADAPALVEAFAGTQRFVLDYLASEVLGGLDPRLRDFVVRSSVVDRFSVDLCRELTGCDESAALLEQAERLNLFLIPLDQERRWYRFHHLFTDYLRTLLEPGEEVALRERAADWLERAGLLDEAVAQAVAARSTERAIRLLEQHARATYQAGELTTLLGWLDRLPHDRVASSPELIALRAISCFYVGRVSDAALACAEGERARPDGPTPGPLLAVRALIAGFANSPGAADVAGEAVEALRDDPFFHANALEALAVGLLAAGRLEVCVEVGRAALAAVAGSRQSMVVVPAMTVLATGLNLTGHRDEAERLCRATLADHQAEARRLGGGTPYAMYWLGMMRYEANDLAGALHDMEAAWTAAGSFGFGRAMLTSAVTCLACARQASGMPEAALDAVRTVRRDALAAGLVGIEDGLGEIEARLHLLQGAVAPAARWADAVGLDGSGDAQPVGWPAVAPFVTVAVVRMAQGRLAEAGRVLDRARGMAAAAGDVANGISVRIAEAALAEASGDRRRAEALLAEAIGLAAPARYVRRIIAGGRGIMHLLPAVRGTAPAFVDEVMAGFAPGGFAPGTGARGTGAPGAETTRRQAASVWEDEDGAIQESLTARELEVLRLMARGRSDAAIAEDLVVSLATAKWHAAHIRAKLGVGSRTQAVLRAQELGLV